MKVSKNQGEKLLAKVSLDPHYRGKSVVVLGNEIHVLSTTNGEARVKLLIDLIKKYPNQTPLISFIPKDDSLILVF